MAEAPCATVSRGYDEPGYATASLVHNWVLVEQPGPWGRDAAAQSRLPAEVAGALQARAREHGFRLLLLRRTAAGGGEGRHCFIAHSRRPRPWIEHRVLTDPGELLHADLRSLTQGERPGFGRAHPGPLYLVCTNGLHDPCCARLGRPIVRALLPVAGEAVWECSHIGGDRFAGNLLCLPHGLYYGRLGPDEALRVVQSYERGLVELDHYRGRAGDPYPVQAAEFFLRRTEQLLGVDDVTPGAYRKVSEGVVEVRLTGPSGRRFRARVGARPAEEPRRLTCAAPGSGHPTAFSLLELVTE